MHSSNKPFATKNSIKTLITCVIMKVWQEKQNFVSTTPFYLPLEQIVTAGKVICETERAVEVTVVNTGLFCQSK